MQALSGGVPSGGMPRGGAAPSPPDGSQLLKPSRGFVVKTWRRQPGRAEFDLELGKVFVNVCSHEDIGTPESKPMVRAAVEPRARAANWSRV